MNRCTGRLPHDPAIVAAIPRAASYMPSDWPALGIDWTRNMPAEAWGMALNDKLGCCTASGAAHSLMTWGSYGKLSYTPLTDPDVLDLYIATSGYKPGQPSTDKGALCTDVLSHWLDNPVGGRKLSAFARVNPQNAAEVRAAVEIFGGLYVGVRLTQQQVDDAGDYAWSPAPGADLGHCIWIPAANQVALRCITWGMIQDLTWEFMASQCDEAYALLHPNWLSSGRTPEGLDVKALMGAMADL